MLRGLAQTPATCRLGVDIGGTFTDAALDVGGVITSAKVLTDYDAHERAVFAAIKTVTEAAGVEPSDIGTIIHGTTLATNALKVDLPGEAQPKPAIIINPVKNIVSVTVTGQILWNGEVMDRTKLRAHLEQTQRMTVEPQLLFQPDAEARYELVNMVLGDIKRSGASKLAFIGNERFGSF